MQKEFMKKKETGKLIIVSNRLPVKAKMTEGRFSLEKSAGGLATGLDSLQVDYEKHWVGWPGIYPSGPEQEGALVEALAGDRFHPVFLTEEEITLYYEGYSNSTLWPLFHYFYTHTRHDPEFWEAYKKVNLLFMEKMLEVAGNEDIIWVQDYQLMLLPSLLRQHLPEARIGFFLHIPFPSFELFRTLENREELIRGVLGADLIGFHTYHYMRHFISSLYRITGIESNDNTFSTGHHTLCVDTFPMGIHFRKFRDAHMQPGVIEARKRFREQYLNSRIVLSVDRLDYSKGLLQRLEGFRLLLHHYPIWIGKVSLVMVLVPSRDSVDSYHDLKTHIDETIGKINGAYSQPGWIPIHYFYRGFSFEELTAFYHESDIALVTPLRDGMNLVAKEFLATKAHRPGVLILSEMAGAAIELTDALLVNPNDVTQMANTLHRALNMPLKEQKERIKRMQRIIKKQDVTKWAGDFIDELEEIHLRQTRNTRKLLNTQGRKEMTRRFTQSGKRLIILDYDGTLVPFHADPAAALPPPSLQKLLHRLAATDNINLAIVSGRNKEFLDRIFPFPQLTLMAEHGAYRRTGGIWESHYRKDLSWQSEIIRIMQDVTSNTPGSFVEKKETALVWHYRNSDKWLAEMRTTQLVNMLIYPCTRKHLHLMKGNKIIEVKPAEYTKGSAISDYFQYDAYEFILAAGDDTTDEDMFEALPDQAFTIKIGQPSGKARFTLPGPADLINLLKQLVPKGENHPPLLPGK